jgi:hypothetical protein
LLSLGLVKSESFQVPALIAEIGPEATKRYFEFFTVSIRNKNTRIAYYYAIGQFLDWCQRVDFRGLEDIEPITVAAYVEQHPGSPATTKQHMSAIRMLFSWLTEKGILAMNPAREVKTEKFSRSEGKTPAFDTDQVQKVLDKIDTSNEVGLRDRAFAWDSCLHFCADRSGREPQGRGLLPDRKAINDPVPGERRQGDGDSRASQTGGAS